MNLRRALLIVLVPVVLTAAMVWLLTRGFGPTAVGAEEGEAEIPARYQLTDVDWTRFDEQGEKLMHAQSTTARYFDDKTARMDDVRLDQLGGEGPWTLTSPAGLVPAREKRVQLVNPVHVVGTLPQLGQVSIDATTLWVDPDRKEIYTSDRVTLRAPGRGATALGLRADWAGERVRLLNQVKVDYARDS